MTRGDGLHAIDRISRARRRRQDGAVVALVDLLGVIARAGMLVATVGLTLTFLGLLHR